MNAQKRVLAELSRIVGMAHHAVDDVPAEPLMVADERLERARRAPASTAATRTRSASMAGWLAWTHPVDRYAPATDRLQLLGEVTAAGAATGSRPSVSTITSPGHTGRDIEARTRMNAEVLIPITLFLCITYAIKAMLDSRTRGKLIAANGSEELIRSLVQNEEQQRRHASLRWGIVLTSLGGRLRADRVLRLGRRDAGRDRRAARRHGRRQPRVLLDRA